MGKRRSKEWTNDEFIDDGDQQCSADNNLPVLNSSLNNLSRKANRSGVAGHLDNTGPLAWQGLLTSYVRALELIVPTHYHGVPPNHLLQPLSKFLPTNFVPGLSLRHEVDRMFSTIRATVSAFSQATG